MRFISLMLSGILFFCLSADTAYSQQDSLQGNVLILNSEPAGASVYIDSAFMGVTPLEIKNLKNGKYIAALRMDGFKDKSYFIEMTGGRVEKYAIMSGDYALISINSDPSEADFYLNDTLAGQTPIINYRIPIGKQKITLKKKDYAESVTNFQSAPLKYELYRSLTPDYGYINLENCDGLSLYIDGGESGISEDSIKVLSGKRQLRFEGPQLLNPVKKSLRVEAMKGYKLRIDNNAYTLKYVLPSLVFPGLGQISDGSYIKGLSMTLCAGAAATYAAFAYRDRNGKLNTYNDLKIKYEKSTSELDAIANYAALEKLAKETNDYKKKYDTALGIFAVIYAISLTDALLNHTRIADLDVYPYSIDDSTGISIKWRIY